VFKKLRIQMIDNTYISANGSLFNGSVVDPSGAALAANQTHTYPLRLAGTYTIFARPGVAGSETYTLYAPPSDVTGQIAINGASVPVITTVPGQMIALTLTPTAGQNVTVSWTGNSIAGGYVFLFDPNGANNFSGVTGASGNLGSRFLSIPGTYTILVASSSGGFGSITLTVTSP
jgi:hypothetical protein